MPSFFARPTFELKDLRACRFFLVQYGGYSRQDFKEMDYSELYDTTTRLEKKLRAQLEAQQTAISRAKRGR